MNERFVLLIDDDDEMLSLLVEVFELTGFHVVGLGTPVNAARIRTKSVDAIVVDVMLVGPNSGIEIAEGLRNAGWLGPLLGVSAAKSMCNAAMASGHFTDVAMKDDVFTLPPLVERLITRHQIKPEA